MSIHIKAYFSNGEIRRTRLPESASWANVLSRLSDMFSQDQLKVLYQDDENERVLIQSEHEWQECLHCTTKVNSPLRFYVSAPNASVPTPPPKEETKTNIPVNPFIEVTSKIEKELPGMIQALTNLVFGGHFAPEHNEPSSSTSPPVELNAEQLEIEGMRAFDGKQYHKSLELLKESQHKRPDPRKLYNIACAYALIGEKDNAIGYLQQAALDGYDKYDHMAKDSDLASLHDMTEFQLLLVNKGITPAGKAAPVSPTVQKKEETKPVPVPIVPTIAIPPPVPAPLPSAPRSDSPTVEQPPKATEHDFLELLPKEEQILFNMGFVDLGMNRSLLQRFGGDVSRTINHLCSL